MKVLKYVSCVLLLLQTLQLKAQNAEANKAVSEQAVFNNYDSVLIKAGIAFAKEEFDSASLYYRRALVLKPSDKYSARMLKTVEVSKWTLSTRQAKVADLQRKVEINRLMKDALTAIVDKNYDSARARYSRVLALNPVASQRDFAQQKIQVIDLALSEIQKSLSKKESTPISTAKAVVQKPPSPAPAVSTSVPANPNGLNTALNSTKKLDGTTTNTSISTPPRASDKRAQQNIASTAIQPKPATNAASTLPKETKKINPAAVRTFNAEFTKASDVTWTSTGDYSKATFVLDDEKMEAFYNRAGEEIGTTRAITIGELPIKVKKALAKDYNGYTVKEVIEFSTIDKVAYYISVENEHESIVLTLNSVNGLVRYKTDQITKDKGDTASTHLLASAQDAAIKKEQNMVSAAIPPKADISTKEKYDTPTTGSLASAPNTAAKKEQIITSAAIPNKADVSTKEKRDTTGTHPLASTPNVAIKKEQNSGFTATQPKVDPTGKENRDSGSTYGSKSIADGASKKEQIVPSTAIKPTDVNTKGKADTAISVPNKFKPAKTEVDRLMDDALTATLNGNYEGARIVYYQVLLSGASRQQKEFAKRKIEDIDLQRKKASAVDAARIASSSTKERNATSSEPVTRKTEPKEEGSPSGTTFKKETSVPPKETRSTVTSPKNGVGPEKSPTEQPRNALSTKGTEDVTRITSKMMVEKGRLDLSDSYNGIRLVCEDITFNGRNSFLKFVIQNSSETDDFIPGSLELSYIRNNAGLQKLPATYLTDIKTVLPKKDFPLVYVADRPSSIDPSDVFIFEMEDKDKKTKLTINIPATVYLNKQNLGL